MICKYLLPFSRLPFCYVDNFLHCVKTFYLVFCCCCCFCISLLLLLLPLPREIDWKNHIATMSKNVVSSSTFKSLFLLYFCKWYKKVMQFHSFACSCPVFPRPYIAETVFPPTIYSVFLSSRFINQLSIGLFLASLLNSIDMCVCFCASTILFDYYTFVI